MSMSGLIHHGFLGGGVPPRSPAVSSTKTDTSLPYATAQLSPTSQAGVKVCRATRSPAVDRRHLRGRGETALQVDGGAEIAAPQRVAAAAVLAPSRFHLPGRMHRESPCPLEPALVARPREELEEREPVACRAVTQARP